VIHPAFADLSPVSARCRLTVTIPARNEAGLLGNALAALAAQRPFESGSPVRGTFDAIVFVNNSSDATAEVARAFAAAHPELPLTVVCADLPRPAAHVGTARKCVMDAAAARFAAAGRPGGLVATTDADTRVDPDWIAQTFRAASEVDAVATHVVLGEDETATLLAPVRLLYSRERSYRRAVAIAEDVIDPQPHDRAPRHASFVGAGFAVTAAAYAAAGGLPPLPALEDLAFSQALRRIDARIRHSTLVRATTSTRRIARVDDGFGSFLAHLDTRASSGETFLVENPRQTFDALESRAALRRVWNGTADAFDRATVSRIFACDEGCWLPLVDRARAFGTVYEAVVAASPEQRLYTPVPVEVATAALRAAAHSSKAPAPTRSKAASGAG
jgi:glycosyltransferase involved in cell wall biosynthesis